MFLKSYSSVLPEPACFDLYKRIILHSIGCVITPLSMGLLDRPENIPRPLAVSTHVTVTEKYSETRPRNQRVESKHTLMLLQYM